MAGNISTVDEVNQWGTLMAMPSEPTVQCAFRLPAGLVERLDGYAETMGDDHPGITFTRADAVRVLLTRALEAVPTKARRKRR